MRIKLKVLSILFLTIGFSQTALASSDLLNEQIVRIINQLNAIKQIIKETERYQSQNEPVKLHLKAFKGADNKMHNGVYEDVELIKKGLIAYINKPAIAPKKVLPIEGDFIESPKKG
jgi:RAQPRD family integrative conjugative element protein